METSKHIHHPKVTLTESETQEWCLDKTHSCRRLDPRRSYLLKSISKGIKSFGWVSFGDRNLFISGLIFMQSRVPAKHRLD